MQFSNALKTWRRKRGFSQEQLGFEANVSARHIAFMEKDRARPSREMVVRLSAALEVPRADRNSLLVSAGFAPLYMARDIASADMANVRDAISWTLDRHTPYPGFAIDRHWNLVMINSVARSLLQPLGLSVGSSLIESFLAEDGLRAAIGNWPEVARYFSIRLQTESRSLGGDEILQDAAERLSRMFGEIPDDLTPMPAVIPTIYLSPAGKLSFFSTISQFGSAEDLALADLRIELLFPADEATRMVLTAS